MWSKRWLCPAAIQAFRVAVVMPAGSAGSTGEERSVTTMVVVACADWSKDGPGNAEVLWRSLQGSVMERELVVEAVEAREEGPVLLGGAGADCAVAKRLVPRDFAA